MIPVSKSIPRASNQDRSETIQFLPKVRALGLEGRLSFDERASGNYSRSRLMSCASRATVRSEPPPTPGHRLEKRSMNGLRRSTTKTHALRERILMRSNNSPPFMHLYKFDIFSFISSEAINMAFCSESYLRRMRIENQLQHFTPERLISSAISRIRSNGNPLIVLAFLPKHHLQYWQIVNQSVSHPLYHIFSIIA